MKTIFLCSVFFLFKSIAVAQVIPTVMSMPTKYKESPDGDIIKQSSKSTLSSQSWIVFSDRDDNSAYDMPSNGTPINTAGFMDKFYVTGESGEFLELYKWAEGIKLEGQSINKVQLNPKKAQRLGWIKKQNLLLWAKCLIDKKTQFNTKAMAVNKVENLDVELRKDNSLKIFNSPDGRRENKNTVKMFNFLYVYKEEGEKVLIGKIYKTQVYRADRDILGWVDKVFLQNWPDRVGLEPNSDEEGVAARKAAGVKASLFDQKEDVIAWKEGRGKPTPNWDYDSYEEKWKGNRQRFPIFDFTPNTDIYYTGFPTDLFKEGTNVSLLSNKSLSEVKALSNEIIKDLRKINIVFVIDASFDMRNYKSAITNSLTQLVKRIKERSDFGENRNKYRFGAVVYRSEEDKICNGGNLSMNKFALTANASSVISFLNKEFETEGCSGNELNKNINGALLEALNLIKDANKEALQSNLVFFLGGASGNVDADLKLAPALIAQYDVNLSVFQVYSASLPLEFEQFPEQFREILTAACARKSTLIEQNNGKDAYQLTPKWKMPERSPDQSLFRLDYPQTSPMLGNINFPAKGKPIPASTIDNVFDETISFYLRMLEDDISTQRTKIEGIGDNSAKYDDNALTATVKNYLNRLGKKMNDYQLARKFNGKNVQLFIPAYTTAKVNRVIEPIFKFVIYVSEDELSEMIKKFTDLQEELPSSMQREAMYDAYQSLVTVYFGLDSRMDEKMKSKLSMDDIISKITGLPSKSTILKDIKIDQIKDVGKVSNDQIDAAIKLIRDSLERLKRVSMDIQGTMRSVTDDGIYYWIPQEILP